MGRFLIQVYQDSDDVKSGHVNLTVNQVPRNGSVYFTIEEWEEFKATLNKFQHGEQKHFTLDNNPMVCLDQDGDKAVHLQFGGSPLCISLYFKTAGTVWRAFLKAVNDYEVEKP